MSRGGCGVNSARCTLVLPADEPPKVRLENRDRLLQSTHQAALAFMEDINHLRGVLGKQETDRGDIRRLSSVLRRLLIDRGGDLEKIATPRLGRLHIYGPDSSVDTSRCVFFSLGGGIVHGIQCKEIAVVEHPGNKVQVAATFGKNQMRLIYGQTSNLVRKNLNQFLNQSVIYLKGKWVKRSHVIKFVANIAGGVHSTSPSTPTESLVKEMASCMIYAVDDSPEKKNVVTFLYVHDNTSSQEFGYSQSKLNAVMFELISAAHFLVLSPSIIVLEEIVKNELDLISRSTARPTIP